MENTIILNEIKSQFSEFNNISDKTDPDSHAIIVQLNEILNLKDEEHIIIRLELFLENRWEQIAGGEYSYLHRPNHPNTVLCLNIAKALHSCNGPNKTAYQYLMPGIKKRFNFVSLE